MHSRCDASERVDIGDLPDGGIVSRVDRHRYIAMVPIIGIRRWRNRGRANGRRGVADASNDKWAERINLCADDFCIEVGRPRVWRQNGSVYQNLREQRI